MKNETLKTEPTVLPPKNGHHADKRENGTTQRMGTPFHTEATVDGVIESSIKMMDQTANGDLDVAQSKAALGHATNAIAGMKLLTSLVRQLDKTNNPRMLGLLADVIGGGSGERFRAAIAAQHPQRQIAVNQSSSGDGNKSNQS